MIVLFWHSWCFLLFLCACLWLQAAAGTMTGSASASLLAAPEPNKRRCLHSVFLTLPPPLSHPFSFLSSYTLPIRECWWDNFCGGKKSRHTRARVVEEWLVDKGKDLLLFYIRDAFVCLGLTHLAGCQSFLFLPAYLLFSIIQPIVGFCYLMRLSFPEICWHWPYEGMFL